MTLGGSDNLLDGRDRAVAIIEQLSAEVEAGTASDPNAESLLIEARCVASKVSFNGRCCCLVITLCLFISRSIGARELCAVIAGD